MALVIHLLDVALGYLGRVALATLAELALVLGPPLLLALVAQPVALQSERWTEGLVGRRARWLAIGWLATALHEGGHAAFALLFGHRVRRVKWFDFDAEGGTLGQVEHDYDPTSLYQRVGRCFIGIGPVLVATLVLAIAARLLIGVRPEAVAAPTSLGPQTGLSLAPLVAQLGTAVHGVGALASAMSATRWQTWAFLYLAYVAGSAMRLSGSDARSFAAGGWVLLGLLLAANALTLWAGALGPVVAVHVARAMALCDAALLAAVALQALVALTALALTYALASFRPRSEALAGS